MKKDNLNNLSDLIAVLFGKSSVDVIIPADERYADARLIYNRMHDCYPGIIIRTLDVEILRYVTDYAFKNNIVLAIRGGGHHIGGFGTCDNGIVIDFSTFKDVYINEEKMVACVSPGACLSTIDNALTQKGYVLPTGTISETGLAGLTLGGGIGWLVGKYGLTCDQLCGADVLLADGRLVRAEDPEHKDLLWALKGGGGNFGIVLNFRYKLNLLPKTVCGMGLIEWKNVRTVLANLKVYITNNCPPAMTIAPVFLKDAQGSPAFRIDFCCADGTADDVEKLLALSPFIEWSHVREWDFAAWQKEFDYILLPPKRGYWKAAYIESFSNDMIETLCNTFENSPNWECTILIEHLHGAFKRTGQETSAFPLRHTNLGILFSARWEDPQHDEDSIDWVRRSFKAIDPNEISGTYSNYTSADDQRAVQNLLATTKSLISKVKLHYDPNNNFKRNHNVIPSRKEEKVLV